MGSWELHNVDLNVTEKVSVSSYRVVFQAVRGKSPSSGGFSLDDINLSSTKCPQHVWRIRNITGLMATTPAGEKLYSPRFLSPAGYSFQVHVLLCFFAVFIVFLEKKIFTGETTHENKQNTNTKN